MDNLSRSLKVTLLLVAPWEADFIPVSVAARGRRTGSRIMPDNSIIPKAGTSIRKLESCIDSIDRNHTAVWGKQWIKRNE